MRVFQETCSEQIFAVSSEVAQFLQLQPASVRARLSQMKMKSVQHTPLKSWAVKHGLLPKGTRKLGFLPQHVLRALCWDRFPDHGHELETAFRAVFQHHSLRLLFLLLLFLLLRLLLRSES